MERLNKMSLEIGVIYKRVFITIISIIVTVFISVFILCHLTKYKFCRFPIDVIYGSSESINESKELGVFIAEYVPLKSYIKVNNQLSKIKLIIIEKKWRTLSYRNEVDKNFLKDSLNSLIILLDKELNLDSPLLYGVTIIEKNEILGIGASINTKKLIFRYYTEHIPDTLNLNIYKNHNYEKEELLYQNVLIKKRH